MLPTEDTSHVAEGKALLVSQYQGLPNIAAVETALLNRAQEIEDMLWEVQASQMTSRTFEAGTAQGQLSGPPDQALLQLADLAGCPAGDLTTAQLAFFLPIWRRARASKGRSEDILQILAGGFGKGNFNYQDFTRGAYEAWILNVSFAGTSNSALLEPLLQALRIARPPGVYALIAWGTWPTETFYFADDYGSGGGSGLADDYSSTWSPGLLAEAIA